MIPERANIEYYDPNYVEDIIFNVRRYGRKSGYYVNIEATIKQPWGDDVSFHVVLYEYLHNEYKRTFVEFHFEHLCKMLKSDPYIGKAALNAGLKSCPLQPNRYVLPNMSIPFEHFPYIWPFEKAKGEGNFLCNKNVIANGTLFMRFTKN
ncbi:hypothetical protein ABMA27_004020 [Loxostege sticticalis]|uniref:Uncharacterized protein n=1 Tax=Loxostege sticticalis TaxID=481309 RepID=A0ABR3HR70_LOXSC